MNRICDEYESVYKPKEDSYLLLDTLVDYLMTRHFDQFRFLEMGIGSGLISIALLSKFPQATGVGVDINPDALHCVKQQLRSKQIEPERLHLYQSNLFAAIAKNQQFDLIFFNPPYVPSFPSESELVGSQNWAGGAFGRETINQFLDQFPEYLNTSTDRSVCMLLVSSQNYKIKDTLESRFTCNLEAAKKLPHEILYYYSLKLNNTS